MDAVAVVEVFDPGGDPGVDLNSLPAERSGVAHRDVRGPSCVSHLRGRDVVGEMSWDSRSLGVYFVLHWCLYETMEVVACESGFILASIDVIVMLRTTMS